MIAALLVSSAFAAPGWTAMLPFGVNLYLRDRPGRGTVYAVTQAAGIGVVVASEIAAINAFEANDPDTAQGWYFVAGGGAGLAVASYFVSVLDGSRIDELERLEKEGKAWAPIPLPTLARSWSPSLSLGSRPSPTGAADEPAVGARYAFAGVPDPAVDKLWTTPALPMEKLGTHDVVVGY